MSTFRVGLSSTDPKCLARRRASDATTQNPAAASRDEQRLRCAVDQSRSEVLTGIIGARRACTVSTISPLSMPCR
jgi:hypothetical protein